MPLRTADQVFNRSATAGAKPERSEQRMMRKKTAHPKPMILMLRRCLFDQMSMAPKASQAMEDSPKARPRRAGAIAHFFQAQRNGRLNTHQPAQMFVFGNKPALISRYFQMLHPAASPDESRCCPE